LMHRDVDVAQLYRLATALGHGLTPIRRRTRLGRSQHHKSRHKCHGRRHHEKYSRPRCDQCVHHRIRDATSRITGASFDLERGRVEVTAQRSDRLRVHTETSHHGHQEWLRRTATPRSIHQRDEYPTPRELRIRPVTHKDHGPNGPQHRTTAPQCSTLPAYGKSDRRPTGASRCSGLCPRPW
jgi:hypothetical protein